MIGGDNKKNIVIVIDKRPKIPRNFLIERPPCFIYVIIEQHFERINCPIFKSHSIAPSKVGRSGQLSLTQRNSQTIAPTKISLQSCREWERGKKLPQMPPVWYMLLINVSEQYFQIVPFSNLAQLLHLLGLPALFCNVNPCWQVGSWQMIYCGKVLLDTELFHSRLLVGLSVSVSADHVLKVIKP